jgi:hypothetical protein
LTVYGLIKSGQLAALRVGKNNRILLADDPAEQGQVD